MLDVSVIFATDEAGLPRLLPRAERRRNKQQLLKELKADGATPEEIEMVRSYQVDPVACIPFGAIDDLPKDGLMDVVKSAAILEVSPKKIMDHIENNPEKHKKTSSSALTPSGAPEQVPTFQGVIETEDEDELA